MLHVLICCAASDPATKVDKWIALKSHVVSSFVCIHLVRAWFSKEMHMLLSYECGAHPRAQHVQARGGVSKHFQAKNSNIKVHKEL
jgi:hypothetical protein